MVRYLLKRLAGSGVLLLAVTWVTFVAFYVITADPGRLAVPRGEVAPLAEVKRADHQLGVDRPIYVQYAKFLLGAVHGDYGLSFAPPDRRKPVGPAVRDAAFVTGSLVVGGLGITLVLGLLLGTRAALRPRSRLDRAAQAFTVFGLALPPVIAALGLEYFFGSRLKVAPVGGYCSFLHAAGGCGGPTQWAAHLALPWTVFALAFVALYTRVIRASVLEVVNEPFVRTAVGKGASDFRVLRSHVLRNALLPVVTIVGMDLGTAVGVAIYIESVFGLPGLGYETIGALNGSVGFDLPFVVAIVFVTSSAILALNLLVDVAYLWLDPRIRLTGRDRLTQVRL